MRGKIGIVVGLAAGYVLGSRAGRERYEQIKTGFLKVWDTPPVQKQVAKVTQFGKSAALAVPTAVFHGAVKVVKAAANKGSVSERVDAARDAASDSVDEVAAELKTAAAEADAAGTRAEKAASA